MSDDNPRTIEYYLHRIAALESAVNIDHYGRLMGADPLCDDWYKPDYREWKKLGTEKYIEKEIEEANRRHADCLTERLDEINDVAKITGYDRYLVTEILAVYFECFGTMDDNTKNRGGEFREALKSEVP